jgi:2-polyprenyl-3-methyl-5-hydroxy-6-metoxy-1,4-benzoquinol methylase
LFTENTDCYQRHELPLLQALWSQWAPAPGGTIAEVGCGYGSLLPLLQQQGYRASGCDPSPHAVQFCQRRGLDVVLGSAPGLRLGGPFDALITQHVIEHVADPRAFVAELVGLTRAGGVVAIVTEDAWNAQYVWERLRPRLLGRPPAFHTSSDHTYVFSASHLATLLRDAGCEDVRTASFSYAPGPESLHWRLYKGTFRLVDRFIGHGDYLMAVGHVGVRS